MKQKFDNDKAKHCLNVARKCYEIAKEKYGQDEDFARKMWLIGYCHDIGYEFTDKENPHDHALIANQMIVSAFNVSCSAILNHGKRIPQNSLELKILNEADLLVDRKGNISSVESRLSDIAMRYSFESPEYTNAHWLAKELELISTEIEEE